jgi:putative tryptophan/tyrosine transport system substrate-binding protein
MKQRTIHVHQTAAEALGISLWPVEISSPNDIEPAFDKMVQDQANGVVRGIGSMLFNERARMGASAIAHRLPVITFIAEEVPYGLLIFVRAGFPRFFPPHSGLRRQNTEGCQARRSSRRATD